MIQYFCSNCGGAVGQSHTNIFKNILEDGATILCAKCSQLPVLNLLVIASPLPQEGTEEFNNQMASELEGSFFMLGGKNE